MKSVIIIKRYDFPDEFTNSEAADLANMDILPTHTHFTKVQENLSMFKTTLDIVIDLFFAQLFKEKQ